MTSLNIDQRSLKSFLSRSVFCQTSPKFTSKVLLGMDLHFGFYLTLLPIQTYAQTTLHSKIHHHVFSLSSLLISSYSSIETPTKLTLFCHIGYQTFLLRRRTTPKLSVRQPKLLLWRTTVLRWQKVIRRTLIKGNSVHLPSFYLTFN